MKLKVIQPRPLPGFMFANKTTKDCIKFFYKSYDSFWLRYLNGKATPTNRKDIQQCTIQINWQLTELDISEQKSWKWAWLNDFEFH
jgi:hypothetical protein